MAKSLLPFLMAIHKIHRPILMLVMPRDSTEHGATVDAACAWLGNFERMSELLILQKNHERLALLEPHSPA